MAGPFIMKRAQTMSTMLRPSNRSWAPIAFLLWLSAFGAQWANAQSAAQATNAQSTSQPAKLLTPRIEEQAQKLVVAGLADHLAYDLLTDLTTRIGARQAGSEAEAAARDWAVAQMRQMGFENVRIEPFPVEGWRRGAIELTLISPRAQKITATALGFSPGTPKGGVEGEIAFFDNLTQLRAAPAGSLKDKIVFVNQPTARAQDGSGYGWSVGLRSRGAQEASKKGAKALLIRSIGTSTNRFAHTGSQSYESGVTPIPAAAISAPDANLLAKLRQTSTAALRIRMQLDAQALGPKPSGNVIGEIVGSEKPDEIVLIGGHLDSWDEGTGAIDDGAGVAITMAAAKTIMATLPVKPKRTIRVVLFGSEEVGLVGAEAYAKAHAAELPKHIIGAESDFGARRIWRIESRVRPEAQAKFGEIAQFLTRLAIVPGGNESFGGPDLQPSLRAGMPVAALTQNGEDYFDTHHTPNDVLERVDPAELPQQVAAYAAFAYLAAELEGESFGPVMPTSRPVR